MRYLLLLLLLTACTTGYTILDPAAVQSPKEYGPPIEIYFCPRDDCSANLIQLLNQAQTSIHCALFDLDIPELISTFQNSPVDVKLVIDYDNHKETQNLSFVRYDTKNQFTHNKFCIIDNNIVWTGSFNPTIRGDTKNNNNAIIIHSKTLANNYEEEFQELWSGQFGSGKPTKTKVLYYNDKKIVNLFCPEDHCAKEIIRLLDNATKSIHFMTFSFTHDFIGNALIKKVQDGIPVNGIFEKSQKSQYSEYIVLKNAGANVVYDTSPAKMHHKVFIIDQNITITGSFNPTNSGDTRNDENVLIIFDKEIAKRYLEEFSIIKKNI